MHLFHISQNASFCNNFFTCVPIHITKLCIVDICLMHCGIGAMCLLAFVGLSISNDWRSVVLCNIRWPSEIHIKVRSRSPITSISFVQSFWNCVQNTAMILPCSVQNFDTIGLLQRMLWTNEILRDLGLRLVSDGYTVLRSIPGVSLYSINITICWECTWGGVIKAPLLNFSVSNIFDLAKVPVTFFESHSYLTGVTAAQLRRHLSNMNVVLNS